tara:strand:- start:247 stop:1161 length:915 start_codon:yes stop_codon:yes gene_type:complete
LIKKINIKKDYEVRLDKYLKSLFTSLTQSFIEKNIRKKNILINNTKTKANYVVKLNDNLIILNFHEELYKNKIIYKKNIKILDKDLKNFNKSIIFQNDDFLVINKWTEIATQGGSKVNVSIDHIIKNINSNYRLVHRLDKETSGLLLISKNLKYARYFSTLFKQKLITKFYIAICEGTPKNKNSKVLLNIKNKNQEIEKTVTNYSVIGNKNNITPILYNPETGKTHQLRKVSKNLGCSIIGDKKYNINSKFNSEKLMLHAFALKFIINDKNFRFIAQLPDYFLTFLKKNKLKFKENLEKELNSF